MKNRVLPRNQDFFSVSLSDGSAFPESRHALMICDYKFLFKGFSRQKGSQQAFPVPASSHKVYSWGGKERGGGLGGNEYISYQNESRGASRD
jgi:hypothetical protein